MAPTTSCTEKVNGISCTQACIDTLRFYRDQHELLVRNEKDLKNEIYNIKKNQKPLKEKVEAQAKDLSRIK